MCVMYALDISRGGKAAPYKSMLDGWIMKDEVDPNKITLFVASKKEKFFKGVCIPAGEIIRAVDQNGREVDMMLLLSEQK